MSTDITVQHLRRRSIRKKGYDYAQAGAYFVTVCVANRACLFGVIVDGVTCLNSYGQIVQACWDELPDHYPHVRLDVCVIMPNHVHGVIRLVEHNAPVGAGLKPAPTGKIRKRHALPEIMRAFKTFSARRINTARNTPGVPIWQRNYYERIVHNDAELAHVRRYIQDNPRMWQSDRENPAAGVRAPVIDPYRGEA